MKILVVGDIVIDKYTYLQTERSAREAQIPIWDRVRTTVLPGAAAAVAQDLKILFVEEPVDVYLAGIVGGSKGRNQMYDIGIIPAPLVGHSTMIKERFVEYKTLRYLFRVDDHLRFPEMDVTGFKMNFDYFAHPQYDAVVVVDYDLGTVNDRTLARIQEMGCPLRVVYTRKHDISQFTGYDILKVNKNEAGSIHPQPFEDKFGYVVVTKGPDGAELRQAEQLGSAKYAIHTEQFPVEKKTKVRDIVGVGDGFLAGLVFSLLYDRQDVRRAVRFANGCASSMIQKVPGTTGNVHLPPSVVE